MGFVGFPFCKNRMNNLTWFEAFETGGAGYDLGVGRKDAGHLNQIQMGNAGFAQRPLKRLKFVAVNSCH